MPAQRVNIKDVAKQTRIGIVTVPRALNGQEEVSGKTRQHIQDIADSLGYRPNRHTRFLKLSFNRSIAVMIRGLDNSLFAEILEWVERKTRAHEYLMSTMSAPHWSGELSEAVEIVNEESMSGVVLLGAQYEHRAADIEKLRVPFVASTVSWMGSAYQERHASVSIDDRGEAKRVADYLYGLGHRRIALLGSDSSDNFISSLRLSGYLEVMRRLGLKPQPGRVRPFDATAGEPYSFEDGYEMTRDLLAQYLGVTVILAIVDVLVIGALCAAHESRCGVSRNLSIVGFDGIPAGEFMHPSLTTIKQPVEKIVEVTCDMLFSQSAGGSPQHVIVSGSLVERGSVARTSPGRNQVDTNGMRRCRNCGFPGSDLEG